jgi:endonuclease/exonuclease/phosphatase family metal-dependent hydrolase
MPSSPPPSLSVLSLNVWGIFNAKHLDERMALIADAVAPYDVVCYQEQFSERHWPLLRAGGHHKHGHRFVSSPVIGPGLSIVSKYPIVFNFFVPFTLHGYPDRPWEGDYYANKGFAISRVMVPRAALGESGAGDVAVTFFNTHMVAPYQDTAFAQERNAPFRMSQALQLAQLVLSVTTAGAADRVVLCGDFNCGLASPEMRLLKAYCASNGVRLGSALTSMADHTYTPANLYNAPESSTYLSVLNMMGPLHVALDHVLFTQASLRPAGGRVAAAERVTVGGVEMQQSDHFGVAVELSGGDASAAAAAASLSEDETAALAFAAAFLREQAAAFTAAATRMKLAAFVLVLGMAHAAIFGGPPTLPMLLGLIVCGATVAALIVVGPVRRAYDGAQFRVDAAAIAERLP